MNTHTYVFSLLIQSLLSVKHASALSSKGTHRYHCANLDISVIAYFGSQCSISVLIHLVLSVFISHQVCCVLLIPTGNSTCNIFSEHLPGAQNSPNHYGFWQMQR